MQNYSFNKWVQNKDLYEVWPDWTKKVGRALGFGGATSETKPYVRPPVPGRYPGRYPEISPVPEQKKTVGVSSADLDNIKVAIGDYLGIISRYLTFVQKHLDPRSMQLAMSSFEQMVGPAYQNLQKWIKWVGDKKIELAAYKAQNPQMREQYDLFILEAVRIKHTDFEQIKAAMQNMSATMRNWVGQLSSRFSPDLGNKLQAVYNKNVVVKQGVLAQQLLAIDRKLQQLMALHNINYQGINTGKPAGYR